MDTPTAGGPGAAGTAPAAGGKAEPDCRFGRQFGDVSQNEKYSAHAKCQSRSLVLPNGVENMTTQNLHMDFYSSFVQDCRDLGATGMAFSR